jgi:L-threonylcarbamoyladenylate synthase
VSANIVPASPAAIARAAERLRAGELVAFPTETVYGLGAAAAQDRAVARIFAAKGRPADHPLIVHLPDASHVPRWAREWPDGARALAEAYWPGPLTMILPRAGRAADFVTGGQDSVGLRVPSHPVARALLASFGDGVAAPSANRFGRISPTTAQHVADDLGDAVSMILDGGRCEVGIESTIVAFVGAEAVLMRPGAIASADLARVLGRPLAARDADAPRAPGTLPGHYAPRTPAVLVLADALRAELAQLYGRDEDVAVLARTVARPADFEDAWIVAPSAVGAYAHDLYANLRALDAANADVILIEDVPGDDAWLAVRDRLARATRGEDDDRD